LPEERKLKTSRSEFEARLVWPREARDGNVWAFVVLPKVVSARLPRRGRTTVQGTMNGFEFRAMLEPDGQNSHWLRVDERMLQGAKLKAGELVRFEIAGVDPEPEPDVPTDLMEALAGSTKARAQWEATTTIARVDWIHWIESAKQAKTRAKRVRTACEMLAAGKKRVCCFDPSGYYSKAFRAPEAAA
jgi:hypothetical protein